MLHLECIYQNKGLELCGLYILQANLILNLRTGCVPTPRSYVESVQ